MPVTAPSAGLNSQTVTLPKNVTNAIPTTVPWNSGISGLGAPPPTQTPPQDGGPQQTSSVQQSPFFHREFPTLGGGSSLGEPTPQYGPGPSLRPESKCTFFIVHFL